jgi:hypothetical protein
MQEVVVETLVAGGIGLWSVRTVPEEAKSSKRELRGEFAGDHAAFDEHRDGRQTEADGGDAARGSWFGFIANETVGGIGFTEVVLERRDLKPVEIVIGRQLGQRLRIMIVTHCDCHSTFGMTKTSRARFDDNTSSV